MVTVMSPMDTHPGRRLIVVLGAQVGSQPRPQGSLLNVLAGREFCLSQTRVRHGPVKSEMVLAPASSCDGAFLGVVGGAPAAAWRTVPQSSFPAACRGGLWGLRWVALVVRRQIE